MQWVIDTVGKLGPLLVAIAVYIAGRRQTAWMNHVGVRAAAVEDQKLRLALFDKRVGAIRAIREAHNATDELDSNPLLANRKASEAIEMSGLLFGHEEQQAVREYIALAAQWNDIYKAEDLDEDTLDRIGKDLDRRSSLIEARLTEITKIELVAPLRPPNDSS